ncbi:MAG: dethiobiotin synthase [Methylococcaceae bacterium]
MEKGYFVTGTDTNVGKTWATIALMQYFTQQGHSVIGMKPVASGCAQKEGGLKNEDALLIQANTTVKVSYDCINPYAYELAVSPHIAGRHNPVNLDYVEQRFLETSTLAEIVIVEGVGGWLSPLNAIDNVEDMAKRLKLPIILVVAIKLGCISHASLTYRAIIASGLTCTGWIASCCDLTMLEEESNIQTLQEKIDAPLLGVFPFLATADFNYFSKRLKF